ncbi:MAG: YbaK/EbsC family protein [bacterium]|nr:YbaK/EbsC family protein [bacterium]
MAIEKVKAYFQAYNMEERIRELDQSCATVQLAAEALGCEAGRIAKTLSFLVDGKAILIVTAGDVKIDNAKYKKQFGVKAKMLSKEQVVEMIGHAVGGVCPFAVNEEVGVFLDESLRKFETVFPACGSSNSLIQLTIPELEKFSKYSSWIDVCKAPVTVN